MGHFRGGQCLITFCCSSFDPSVTSSSETSESTELLPVREGYLMLEKEVNALTTSALAEVFTQCFLLKTQVRIQEHPTILWHYLGPLFYLGFMLNE